MEKELELLKTFPAVSREAWKQKAIEDLKGADFDRRLVWKTYEGIAVQPFYTKEDTEGNILPSEVLHLPETKQRSWVNYIEISVTNAAEANKTAHKMLYFDATGIVFNLKNAAQTDPAVLLQGLSPEKLNISFKTEKPSVEFLKKYFSYCESQNIPLSKINGFYESDVLESYSTKGEAPDFISCAQIVETTAKAPGFYGLTIRSHAFADSGANTAQEIAFTCNKLIDYITELSENSPLSTEVLLQNVLLHTATGGDYFFEISKIRAFRLLFQTIAKTYGVSNTVVKILSSSGLWTKSLFDPNVNMLRNTTEAMSSIIGGCDALLIQPHDSSYQLATDFSRRIALNLSNLLKEEAYLDKVTDPAAGSYYLENLTTDLAEKAFDIFKQIEAAGGFTQAFGAGTITEAVEKSRKQKEADITSRRKVFVGTNKYPNLKENIAVTEIEELAEESSLLQPQRATRAFDTLRLTTIKQFKETGFVPKVYLACFGNLAMRKARATFAAEFFGVAGFEIMGEFVQDSIEKAATAAAQSAGDLIVMCAADPDYEAEAAAFATTFKALAPDKHLVVAGWPETIVDSLKEAGVDSFIHMKVNAIDALTNYQNMLFQSSKIL